MNTTGMTPTITDHTAVNWQGDPATLDAGQLVKRMDALANYAAARLRPYATFDASPRDAAEADRALDMWNQCRGLMR